MRLIAARGFWMIFEFPCRRHYTYKKLYVPSTECARQLSLPAKCREARLNAIVESAAATILLQSASLYGHYHFSSAFVIRLYRPHAITAHCLYFQPSFWKEHRNAAAECTANDRKGDGQRFKVIMKGFGIFIEEMKAPDAPRLPRPRG